MKPMNKIYAFCILAVISFSAAAQTTDDLVKIWLSQAGKAIHDYSACDPSPSPVFGTEGICSWGSDLGPQPTPTQLLTLASLWRAQQTSQTNAALALLTFAAAITGGLTITDPNSHCAPCVGVWAIDDMTEMHIDSQISTLFAKSVFTNGQSTRSWPNLAGTAAPTFTVAQFETLGALIGIYKDSLIQTKNALLAGQSVSWPNSSATVP